MSKKFEALEQAERDLKGDRQEVFLGPEEYLSRLPALHLEDELLSLQQTIDAMVPKNRKSIQFLGICGGEGASTLCREFARASSMKLGKTVLLIDADRKSNAQFNFFHLNAEADWSDVLMRGAGQDRAFQQVGNSTLYLSLVCRDDFPGNKVFACPGFRDFWDKLRERFDMVLFDTAPLPSSSEALGVAKFVDGTILVLEAEKTRWPAAENVRDRVRESGGNVLGTIFNKRRYHIPEAIYKRL